MIRRVLIAITCIVPAVVRVIVSMGSLVITTVLAFWRGIPAAVEKLVRIWMEQAWKRNVPTEYDTLLRWAFTGIAYLMIFASWVGFSYLTVFLLTWLLR